MLNGPFPFAADLFPELTRLQQHLDEFFPASGGATSIRALAHGAFPAVNMGSSPDSVEVIAKPETLDRVRHTAFWSFRPFAFSRSLVCIPPRFRCPRNHRRILLIPLLNLNSLA